jgi:hypothetical protein
VKPYVRRGKNDATDAEAICEAVTRPSMRFEPVKSAAQQSVLMFHRVRALLIRQTRSGWNTRAAQVSISSISESSLTSADLLFL